MTWYQAGIASTVFGIVAFYYLLHLVAFFLAKPYMLRRFFDWIASWVIVGLLIAFWLFDEMLEWIEDANAPR